MKRFPGLVLVFALGLATTFLGCADLKTIDFSGEIRLTPQAATNDVGMLSVAESTFTTHWQLDRNFYLRPFGLNEYLNALIRERSYLSRDSLTVAKEVAICGSPYNITTTINRNGKVYLEVEGRKDGFQALQNLDWNESGDPFWKSFDFADEQWETGSLHHEGVVKNSYTNLMTNKVFMLKSSYRLGVYCKRVFTTDNGQKRIDSSQSYLDVELKSSTEVGYSQYLSGEKTFIDQKGRKATMTVTVIDRDLDGQFTEGDGVDVTISNSFFHRDNIPFGQPLKLDSRSANSYLVNLAAKSDGSYAVVIKGQ